MQVTLTIPEDQRHKSPKFDGEYYGYHDRTGELISEARNGGLWISFDGHLVGCPAMWVSPAPKNTA